MPVLAVQEQLESSAENVRRRRARLGMTQEALCEVSGFDIRFIQKLERARLNFSIETLVRLAAALDAKARGPSAEAEASAGQGRTALRASPCAPPVATA